MIRPPVALALLAIVLATVLGYAGVRQSAPVAAAGAAARGSVTPEPAYGSPAPASRSTAAELRLRIRRADGQPCRGAVAWTTLDGVPAMPDLGPALRGQALPQGVERQAHEGSLTLPFASGRQVWLAVAAAGSPPLVGHARIALGPGENRHEIVLAAERRTVHVFVLRPDLGGSATSGQVSLFGEDASKPSIQRPLDGQGYACFPDLPPSVYLACAPGAGREARPPHACRLLLTGASPLRETVCLLIAAEPMLAVQLEADVRVSIEPGTPLHLFARRSDECLGDLHPLGGLLRKGRQTIAAQLPVGEYVVDLLPLGAAEILPSPLRLEVSAANPCRAEITIRPPAATTRLTLAGAAQAVLPGTLHARRAGWPVGEDEQILYVGPHRWALPALDVGEVPYDVHLSLSGRTAYAVTVRPVQVRGRETTVELVAGTLLRVRWFAVGGAARAEVAIAGPHGVERLQLRPRLIGTALGQRACLEGSIVLPGAASYRLECTPAGAAQPAWTRTVELGRAVVDVDVTGTGAG